MNEHRRILLFRVSAILDVKELSRDFLSVAEDTKDDVIKLSHAALSLKARENGGSLPVIAVNMELVFWLFQNPMRDLLASFRCRDLREAVTF